MITIELDREPLPWWRKPGRLARMVSMYNLRLERILYLIEEAGNSDGIDPE